jgi:glucosamine--fructose-6-phosphate aminotransferase (isomerizing)
LKFAKELGMCGIIGYVGSENAIDKLKYGLKQLEYRGYDSAGICYYDGKKFVTTKKAGTVDNLFRYVEKDVSKIGIGHTRWATHGKATDENSHPHKSFYGKVSVVHNGIIENYEELKQTEIAGIKLKSETDTEVVCNLIEKYYIMHGDKIRAICETMKLLKGSYALGILFDDDTENIYFAKNFSPLLIGIGKSGNYISSDILGFGEFTNKFVEIADKTLGRVSATSVEIFDINGKKLSFDEQFVPLDRKDAKKDGYPFFMIKEINEVPKIIEETAKLYAQKNSPLFELDKFFDGISRIKLVACGTSYHACLVGENLLNAIGFDATACIASEFIYSNPYIDSQTLCVFVSQSGETADTLSAVKLAKEKGAKTLAITNVQTSTITKICHKVLPIRCGAEIAVASTKAYIGQLCAILTISSFLTKSEKNIKKTLKNLKKVSKIVDIQDFDNQIKPLIKEVLSAKNVFMVGRHNDYVASLESALKLKEITYLNCQGYASGELKHGTISLVENGTLVFAFVTEKHLASKTMNVIRQTQSRGAKICVVSPFDELLADDTINFKIKLPAIPETYYPLISVIPMQLLAYQVSVALGNNPDKPRNLAKSVTVE